MKRFWKIVSIALICGALATPQIDARGRNNNGNNRSVNASASRSNTSRPNANKNKAPKPNNNAPKPDGSSSRPGGNQNNAPKPGNNNSRPGGNQGNNHNAPKPGNNNFRPDGNRGNNRPNPGNHNPKPAPKPNYGHAVRPHCPPPRPYHRPTPPPSFRPYSGCPVLRSVFGITFGTAINLSLDYLYRNSYDVLSYGNDVVYLRNVSQYGYTWPDATLYYGSNGLTGTQLIYSTSYNSRSRYNNVYNTLYNQYGAPISVQNTSNGIVATWWGYDNQYVSLEYHPSYTNNGQLRYFTTLSFGV